MILIILGVSCKEWLGRDGIRGSEAVSVELLHIWHTLALMTIKLSIDDKTSYTHTHTCAHSPTRKYLLYTSCKAFIGSDQ